MLTFAGGAAGKLACGALAERIGVIRTVVVTEAATGLGVLLLLGLPLGGCLAVLPALGIALNGTSSVLYGSVADLVDADRRSRSYAIFYTVGIGASALSPFVYGLVSDWGGVRLTLGIVGIVVFATLPLTLRIRS
jgi:MFS family permease